jgi:hypothetical protein
MALLTRKKHTGSERDKNCRHETSRKQKGEQQKKKQK